MSFNTLDPVLTAVMSEAPAFGHNERSSPQRIHHPSSYPRPIEPVAHIDRLAPPVRMGGYALPLHPSSNGRPSAVSFPSVTGSDSSNSSSPDLVNLLTWDSRGWQQPPGPAYSPLQQSWYLPSPQYDTQQAAPSSWGQGSSDIATSFVSSSSTGSVGDDSIHRAQSLTVNDNLRHMYTPTQTRHHPYLNATESSMVVQRGPAGGIGAATLTQPNDADGRPLPPKSGRLGVKRRQKYTRSRTGCLGCRARRIKCDEGRPVCRRCQVAKRECQFPDPSDGKKGKKTPSDSGEDDELREKSDPGLSECIPAGTEFSFDLAHRQLEGYDLNSQQLEWGHATSIVSQSSILSSSMGSVDLELSSPTKSASSVDAASDASDAARRLIATSIATNTPLLTTPNFLLPWFPTAQEQSLILHYCANAADLMMAIPSNLNPLLAINLPLALNAPRGANSATDALRITLLGIGAVHQAFLLARSGVNTPQTAATFHYASNLRDMGKSLVRRAVQEGFTSDAALSAGMTLASLDILFGGEGWRESFDLTKGMVALRGGPSKMLKDSTTTQVADGVTVTPARLMLEVLAIYETFGSLTLAEEPELISESDDWWFSQTDSSYETRSVDTRFGMSRGMVHLFSRTARLLARVAKAGNTFLPEPAAGSSLDIGSVLGDVSPGDLMLPRTMLPTFIPSHGSGDSSSETVSTTSLAAEAAHLHRDIDSWIDSLTAAPQEHERVHVGNAAYAHAMKVLLLRMVYGRQREDASVQTAAHEVLQHCSIGTASLGMSIDLMWPAVVAGCCVEGPSRQWLLTLLEGFKSQCCFDVDTATRIIQEVWRRVDVNEPRADWKPVCDDLGLHVLLC